MSEVRPYEELDDFRLAQTLFSAAHKLEQNFGQILRTFGCETTPELQREAARRFMKNQRAGWCEAACTRCGEEPIETDA